MRKQQCGVQAMVSLILNGGASQRSVCRDHYNQIKFKWLRVGEKPGVNQILIRSIFLDKQTDLKCAWQTT